MNEQTTPAAEGTTGEQGHPTRRHVVHGLGALALGTVGLLAAPASGFVALQPAASAAQRRTRTGPTNHTVHTRHSRHTHRSRRRRR